MGFHPGDVDAMDVDEIASWRVVMRVYAEATGRQR